MEPAHSYNGGYEQRNVHAMGRHPEPEDWAWVDVILRDAHDTGGTGMMVGLKWINNFKNIFDHFKAMSCKNCRAPQEMRFKTGEQAVFEHDTPQKVRFFFSLSRLELGDRRRLVMKLGFGSGSTIEIKVWSNAPGMLCNHCKQTGYPSIVHVDRQLQYQPAQVHRSTINNSETITLLVGDQTGFEVSVRMLNTVGFHYLMDVYASSALRNPAACQFSFRDERITEHETPAELSMVRGDHIEVVIKQTNGWS